MVRSGIGWCPFAEQVEGLLPSTYAVGNGGRVGFVDHTAGGFYTTLKNPAFWNGQGYSVTFGLGLKGQICQMVNLFDTAYGQGRDSNGNPIGPTSPGITWPPFATMGKKNPNGYMVSTEHEDAITVNGQPTFVPGSEWPEAMYQADVKLKRWCIEEAKKQAFDLLYFGIDSLAGHHMFDPVHRAECPGKFWRNDYREKLYADLTGAEDVYVIADKPASYFDNLSFNGPQRINTFIDFGWPVGTKLGRVQFLMYSGFFDVLNGNGVFAQTVGWGNVNEGKAFPVIVEVVPDKDGWISLNGFGHFNSARGLGYWQ